ncbi:hypothetical protein V496_02452 [Pseudogymnoascus sp. VKM F-4515 (FW-2607)]|nr:hypothetical protein V496_02452 [Pseudogymnoascus sp. VKM F-4515 (FW-2607)]
MAVNEQPELQDNPDCTALVEKSTGLHEAQSHDEQESLSDGESPVSPGSDSGDCQTGSRVPSETWQACAFGTEKSNVRRGRHVEDH